MKQKNSKNLPEKATISLDDFGISEVANYNILKLVSSEKIGRVSIMIHGKINAKEIALLLSSGVKLDIHLDINNKIDEKRKLKDGFFKRILLFILNYLFGKHSDEKVREIWENQIIDFQKKFNRNPDGISSHQHVHFFPPFCKVMLELAKKHGIEYIRLGKNNSESFNLASLLINLLRTFNKKNLFESNIASSDLMLSADWIKNFKFEEHFEKIPSHEQIELIFHPEREEEFIFLSNL